MAYKTGYTTNSHNLAHTIHAAMLEAGWTVVSELNNRDTVFYSTGTSGNEDIYVRVAAGLSDRQSHGDIQRPNKDGYTGYVNFFAYQYFPTGASSAEEGTNEVGRFGPFIYLIDTSSSYVLEEYSLFKTSGDSAKGRDIYTQSYASYGAFNYTDGHRYMFDGLNTYQYLMRYDLGTYPEIGYTTYDSDFLSGVPNNIRTACFSRKSSTEPVLWHVTTGTYGCLCTYNILSREEIRGPEGATVYAQPPWAPGNTYDAWMVQGTGRAGKKYLYTNRGSSGGGVGTATWARYDMDKNQWTTLPNLPYTCEEGASALIMFKENTGYDHDRLYITRGREGSQLSFSSIAIDDDEEIYGSWVSHADTLSSQGRRDALYYLGGNKIWYFEPSTGNYRTWQFPVNPVSAGTWQDENAIFSHNVSGDYNVGMWVKDHLASRVGVEEFKPTEYHVFADKNRVVVLTQPDEAKLYSDRHDFAYAGAFESFSNTHVAELTANASGSTIDVDDVSKFKVGTTYKIAEINTGQATTLVSGEEVYVGKTETFTVDSVSQSTSQVTLTSSLIYSYTSGAKIGEDVQPVGVSIDALDKIHTLNIDRSSNKPISKDRPYQWYHLQYPQLQLNTASERGSSTLLWPILLRHDSIDESGTPYTKSGIRGKLIDVYLTGSVSRGDTIDYNGSTYKIFGVHQSAKISGTIAVGPME